MEKILINAHIHSCKAKNYEQGYIHIKGQDIFAVGDMSDCPSFDDMEVIDLTGLTIYPGFIDAHCHLGMWEDGLNFEGADGNEETDPITAQLRAIDGINPQDRCFSEAVEAGVTSVVTGPGSANPIGGTLTYIHCHGSVVDEMTIKEPIAMKMALGENPKSVYHEQHKCPETRMGTISVIRNALYEAVYYDKGKKESYNAKNIALTPVVKGELAAHIHAHRTDDIFAALRVAKEFNLDMTVVHGTEGYLVAEQLAQQGVNIILGPIMSERSKPELRNLTPKAGCILEKNGVKFAICTDHPVIPIQYLPIMAGLAVREGLSRDTAMRAITCIPAEILGLADRVGSIAPGLIADLAIFKGDPLSLEGVCMMTIIKGEIVYKA